MHIVYRLKGSIPQSVIETIWVEYARHQKDKLTDPSSDAGSKNKLLYERLLEDALHQQSNGPYHLSKPEIAKAVLDSWQWIAENSHILVYAVCVMSNHVHVLAASRTGDTIPAGSIVHAHKSYTSLRANRLLGTQGTPFWEISYFDRDVRPGKLITVMWYVLNNPVKDGLVTHWEDWPFTFLNPEYDMLFRPFSEDERQRRISLEVGN